jgi:hypothetical protein
MYSKGFGITGKKEKKEKLFNYIGQYTDTWLNKSPGDQTNALET